MTWMKASVFSVAFSLLVLGSGEAGAQYVQPYTPPSVLPPYVPPTYQAPSTTYIIPPAPPPRTDGFVTPPSPIVICNTAGRTTICQ